MFWLWMQVLQTIIKLIKVLIVIMSVIEGSFLWPQRGRIVGEEHYEWRTKIICHCQGFSVW